jgi:hypothetical protein
MVPLSLHLPLTGVYLEGYYLETNLNAARELVRREGNLIAAEGGKICVEQLPLTIVEEDFESGPPGYRMEGEEKYRLWYFPRMSFDDSLELLNTFDFLYPPSPLHRKMLIADLGFDLEDNEIVRAKRSRVRQFLSQGIMHERMFIAEFHYSHISLLSFDRKDSWRKWVETAMAFNIKEFDIKYSKTETGALIDMLDKAGRAIIGYI